VDRVIFKTGYIMNISDFYFTCKSYLLGFSTFGLEVTKNRFFFFVPIFASKNAFRVRNGDGAFFNLSEISAFFFSKKMPFFVNCLKRSKNKFDGE